MIAARRLMLCGVIILSLLVSCDRAPAPKPSRAVAFLGERAIKVLDAADKIEVFRIEPIFRDETEQRPRFAGHALLATTKEQGREYIAQLSGTLRDDGNYDWNSYKQCIFSPGIGYRI